MLKNISTNICEIICEAGLEVLKLFYDTTEEKGISLKQDKTLVTKADSTSQEIIIEKLKICYPDIPILAEEGFNQSDVIDKEHLFLVDPVDGTSSFARGFPLFAISISMLFFDLNRYSTQFAVVHEPVTGRTWWAIKNSGTYMAIYDRYKKTFSPALKVSVSSLKNAPPGNSMIVYDAAMKFRNIVPSVNIKMAAINRTFPLFRRVRMIGSNALQFAYVASGIADASVTDAVGGPYDIASHLLVDEAGGCSTDLDLNPIDVFKSKVVVATNGQQHERLVNSIKNIYTFKEKG